MALESAVVVECSLSVNPAHTVESFGKSSASALAQETVLPTVQAGPAAEPFLPWVSLKAGKTSTSPGWWA